MRIIDTYRLIDELCMYIVRSGRIKYDPYDPPIPDQIRQIKEYMLYDAKYPELSNKLEDLCNKPIVDMPLYINDKSDITAFIAKWRLKNGC